MRSWVVGSMAKQLVAGAPRAMLIATPATESQGIDDPAIEPPRPDCLAMCAQPSGSRWCKRQPHHAKEGHTFSYRRELPFAMHDSEVIPTGVAMWRARVFGLDVAGTCETSHLDAWSA